MNNLYSNRTYFSETTLPENMKTYQDAKLDSNIDDVTKGTVINGYYVLEKISNSGNESTVYKVIRAGEVFALKLYKRSFIVSEKRMEIIKRIESPYVARLIDYSYYNEHLYEVYEYYEKGTLLNVGRVDSNTIKKYIYQLNEGLHALHKASSSITLIHGDIKPSNIFFSNDFESVIIGDFGISMIVEDDTFGIGEIAGTAEYSPPSLGILDKVRKTPAFDYGSLGLVIYFMVCGYSKFAGMTTTDIAKEWTNGITLDEIIDSRLKMLLSGLLILNENARFGYEKVKEWYEGSYITEVTPKNIYYTKKSEENASLWFGIFDNESITVTSIKELVLQMKKHWEQAIYKMRDENFYEFLSKFSETKDLVPEIRRFVSEEDINAAVFKTIYLLSEDAEIVYKGVNFGNAENFIEIVSAGKSDVANELLINGLFTFYIQKIGCLKNENKNNTIEDILKLRNCSNKFKLYVLTYIFSKEKKYNNYETLNDLRMDVCNMSLEEISFLANDVKFISWLYYLGHKDEALYMINSRGEINE